MSKKRNANAKHANNSINQRRKKTRMVIRTLPWGTIFLLIVPIYAAIYLYLGEEYIDFGERGCNVLSCIYLSMSTITTLGIGDIAPATDASAVLVGSECFFGVIAAGMFLNSIAFRKTESVNDRRQHEADIEKYDYECKKMLQFCKVIEITLNHYEESILMMLDGSKFKKLDDINESLMVADMTKIFESVFTGNAERMIYTRVNHFITVNNNVVMNIRQLIREINMEYWPDFESFCLDYIDNMSDLRLEEFYSRLEDHKNSGGAIHQEYIHIYKMAIAGENGRCEDEEMIDGTDSPDFSPFADLCDMTVYATGFIKGFRKYIEEISVTDPENIVGE